MNAGSPGGTWIRSPRRARSWVLTPITGPLSGGGGSGAGAITLGFQYFPGADLDRGLPFRAKMARAFAWGAQLGWIGAQILDPKYAHEAEYLRNLAQCRHRAHEFLEYG